jgi:NTP pyrophosphatase (non-canonical NTP hydrolase)
MYNFDVMDISDLTQKMHHFVQEKGWYDPDSPRPQTPRNLAASLSIEAAEVLELFQWIEETPDPNLLAGELADVMLYLLQLASISEIDLEEAVLSKLKFNYERTWNHDLEKKKESNDNEN